MQVQSVAAITVNWNDAERSVRCLSSVAADSSVTQLVLVDNGSNTDPEPVLLGRLPHASLVRRGTNGGYAAGCNAGAAAAIDAGASHLLFLNNDTVLEPGAIAALLRADSDHPGSIFGPKIVYGDRPAEVWSAGGFVVRPLMANHHHGQGEPAARHSRPRAVDWTTGCAMFVSAATYERIGPLDEDYFLYLEDTDWCLRAAGLGVETWFVPDGVVRHEVSATVEALPSWHVRYYAYRNHYRLALRHAPWPAKPLVLADAVWTLVKAATRSIASSERRHDAYYHARTRGVADFMRRRWGAAPR